MVEVIDAGLVNVFLVRGARAVLVDAGYPGSAPRIRAAMDRLSVRPDDVSLVLISHGHIDHFGGAAELREWLGAPIAVHRADAACLRRGVNARMEMDAEVSELARTTFLRKATKMQAPPLEPDILLDGELDLAPFGVEGRVIPTPGHSPGSVSVALPGGAIIVADLLMQTRVPPPRVALPLFFDDQAEVLRSLGAVLAREPAVLFASHGGAFSPEAARDLLLRARGACA
ncbi:MAG: MBL fold metallo-hydrolase [Polyangiaceae bacterium]|nr:MBL fold metallo-hydrolase [Polyangiaceae bacterium]